MKNRLDTHTHDVGETGNNIARWAIGNNAILYELNKVIPEVNTFKFLGLVSQEFEYFSQLYQNSEHSQKSGITILGRRNRHATI